MNEAFLREHRWKVWAEGGTEPVAHFSNWKAARDTAEFLSGPKAMGGTGILHYYTMPEHLQ